MKFKPLEWKHRENCQVAESPVGLMILWPPGKKSKAHKLIMFRQNEASIEWLCNSEQRAKETAQDHHEAFMSLWMEEQ